MNLTELDQLNAIIGLSRRIKGWPSTLADLGYVLERVELKIKKPDPARPGISIEVTPDILFLADERNFSFVVELKSGHLQDFIQLDKLVEVTPIEMVRYGRIVLSDMANVIHHKISVGEVINEEFLSEYLDEFQRVGHKATLICISNDVIKSHHGTLNDAKLDKEFKSGILISDAYRPTRLIVVLPTTSDKYTVTRTVVEAFKETWINNERSVTTGQLAQNIFKGIWGVVDNWAREQFLKEARAVLKDMEQTEFNRYLRPAPGSDEWKILNLPESLEHKRQSRAIQIFQAAAREYKWRRKNNQPFRGRVFAQTSLEDIEGFITSEENPIPPVSSEDSE
jgi:hypothetical protein